MAASDQSKAHIAAGLDRVASSRAHVEDAAERIYRTEEHVRTSVSCIARSFVKLRMAQRSLREP